MEKIWIHTSVNEQELHPEVGITHTHEEDVIHVVELEVVVPDVAHELLDLSLLRPLVHLGSKCLRILYVGVSTILASDSSKIVFSTSGCVTY